MIVNRRRALAIFGGVMASPLFGTAAFAKSNKEIVTEFYLTTTKAAFEQTFGDTLSAENVKDIETLNGILGSKGEEYSENLTKAALDHYKALPLAEQDQLFDALNDSPTKNGRNNWLGAIRADIRGYNANGHSISAQTNPLFSALETLRTEGVIADADYYTQKWGDGTYLDLARNRMYETGLSVLEQIKEIRESAPAPDAGPKAEKRERKF